MDYKTFAESLDLSQERERMTQRGGLDESTAELASELYTKFLFLCRKYGSGLTPSRLIDTAWHEHMSNTAKYRADCQALCGGFIDHDPTVVGTVMANQYNRTKTLFKSEFDIDLGRTIMCDVGMECGSVSITLEQQNAKANMIHLQKVNPTVLNG